MIARYLGMCGLFLLLAGSVNAALTVGFADADITPELNDDRPVWLAGYGPNRRATGVHDPLYARAVVLDDGAKRIALVSVDLVGLQLPTVDEIRGRLKGFDYVLVASTHNHEGPDTIGLWGPSPLKSGVDPQYMELVTERTVEAITKADKARTAATAVFGTAEDESLVNDSRLPIVKDAVLRVLRFDHADGSGPVGILVQWNSHPESLGSKNTLVTCDFPYATIAALESRYGCPIAYFSGAVGGLMAPPGGRYARRDPPVASGTFEYAAIHGREIAELASRALEQSAPIELSPFHVAAQRIAIPLENPWYRLAQMMGVIARAGRTWNGDYRVLGDPQTQQAAGDIPAAETEVACLRFGVLHVACIPGEIYPELLYGRFQDPPEPHADFPEAPRERAVVQMLPERHWMLLGLANDEIGYIIPRCQWDNAPPYAYGKPKGQYGEINSCGPQVAPIIMQALEDCVRKLPSP